MSGRLVAVIDVYDSLIHERVYRPALSEEEVLHIIAESSGTHFDPAIHQLFLDVLPELRELKDQLAEPSSPNVVPFERFERMTYQPKGNRVDSEAPALLGRR